MKSYQKRAYQASLRVKDWLGENPTVAAEVAPFAAELSTVITAWGDAGANQLNHTRSVSGAAAETLQLRDILITDMRIISRIAGTVIPDVAKATEALVTPPDAIDTEGLFTAAVAMANAAEQHLDVLLKGGLSANALPRLREVTAQYRAAASGRGMALALRSGATEAIATHMSRARTLVDTIAPMVKRALRGQPTLLAEWKQLKRVTLKTRPGSSQVRGSESTAETPATPTQASAATPPSSAEVTT
jgi:hypothetical protein